MPNKGEPFNVSVVVDEKPETLINSLVAVTTGVRGYSVSALTPNSLILTRAYYPTWVIVVAILLFPVGLLALIYRESEALTTTLAQQESGTQLQIVGVATPELETRILSSLQAAPLISGHLPEPREPPERDDETPAGNRPPDLGSW